MVNIRLATIKDCNFCKKLSEIEELQTPEAEFITEEYLSCFVDKDEMFLVAEKDNKIVGFILGEPMKGNVALLGLLAVDSNYRGQNIGTKLLKKFRESCNSKHIEYIFLYAPNFNKQTLDFYKKQNFTQGKEYVVFGKQLN